MTHKPKGTVTAWTIEYFGRLDLANLSRRRSDVTEGYKERLGFAFKPTKDIKIVKVQITVIEGRKK